MNNSERHAIPRRGNRLKPFYFDRRVIGTSGAQMFFWHLHVRDRFGELHEYAIAIRDHTIDSDPGMAAKQVRGWLKILRNSYELWSKDDV